MVQESAASLLKIQDIYISTNRQVLIQHRDPTHFKVKSTLHIHNTPPSIGPHDPAGAAGSALADEPAAALAFVQFAPAATCVKNKHGGFIT
jgi:hypothetical protein